MYAPPVFPSRVLLLCLLLALSACSDDTPRPEIENVTAVSVEGNPLPPLFEHALYELRYNVNLTTRERLYRPDGKGRFFFEDILHAQQPYPGVVDIYVESEQPELEVYFVVHWPSIDEYEIDDRIEREAARLLGEVVGDFALEALPRGGFGKAPEKVETEYAKEHPTWYLPIHPVMISYEFSETPGGAISVNFRSWGYGGGAHDNWTYTTLNLRRHDDREIELRDIFPNAEILVVREDGTPCAPGEPGELVHRGALVALGYWNDPAKTAERYRPVPGQNPGLPLIELAVWSGDTVRIDEDGFLYFIGRKDDMIKTSGYRVSPTEIEEVLYGSGQIAEAAALGIPHPALGQAIIAVVKPLRDEFNESELLNHCRRQLPNFMVPLQIIARQTDLPRNPNGKIDRKSLVEALHNLFPESTP